jgi:hypothetical protein
MAEGADDTVQERLGADEAVVGEQVSAIGEMLARSEADLEMQRPVVAEQELGGDRPLLGDGDRRQQLLEQSRLPLPKLVAGAPPVQAAYGGGVVQSAALSLSTKSVFSQVNRSPSGSRPKWP